MAEVENAAPPYTALVLDEKAPLDVESSDAPTATHASETPLSAAPVAAAVAEIPPDPWAVEPGISLDAYVSPTHPWCTGRAYSYPPSQDLQPIRVLAEDSNGYYSVTRGRMVGVFMNANIASEMVTGISNPANKRYTKQADALNAFNRLRRDGLVGIAPARQPRPARPNIISLTSTMKLPNRRRTVKIENRSDDENTDDDPVIVLLDSQTPPPTTPPPHSNCATLDSLTDALAVLSVRESAEESQTIQARNAGTSSQRTPRNSTENIRDPADETLYDTTAGLSSNWFEAAHLNTPQTPVRALVRRGRSRKKARAYVVFLGITPGVYMSWDQCEEQIKGVPNIYQGYRSVPAAQSAYTYATAHGLTRSTTAAARTRYRLEWTAPRQWDYSQGCALSEGVTEARWYVVYVGIQPGIYATSLEAQLQTLGIPRQTHEAFKMYETARAKYFAAVTHRKIAVAIPAE